jgi:hypothetical protein
MKWTAIASIVLVLSACAIREWRCDSALRPINTSPPHSVSNLPAVAPR